MSNAPVFFRMDNILQRLNIDEVIYLSVDHVYVYFQAKTYCTMIRTSLDAVMKLLPPDEFVRTSRSAAVAIKHISTISREVVSIIGYPELLIPISKRYYPNVLKQLTIIKSNSTDAKKVKRRLGSKPGENKTDDDAAGD